LQNSSTQESWSKLRKENKDFSPHFFLLFQNTPFLNVPMIIFSFSQKNKQTKSVSAWG